MDQHPSDSRPSSKATTINPKDLLGIKKVSITKLPAAGIIHGAHAMMHGAEKYGPYNWRAKEVVAGIYIDAAIRHLLSWFEGEETANDSGVHHLGHALACCAILLDAQETGNLRDDRPICDDPTTAVRVLDRLSETIKQRSTDAKKELPTEPLTVSSVPYGVGMFGRGGDARITGPSVGVHPTVYSR